MKRKEKEFCCECRKKTTYKYKLCEYDHNIGGKKYKFKTTCAICDECGNDMGFPELIDVNNLEVSTQYRQAENLIQNEEIELLMKTYNLEKTQLSLALGFEEKTIPRYFESCFPNKENTNIIRKALSDPKYMLKCINDNKDKLSETVYKKVKAKIDKTLKNTKEEN